MSNEPMKDADLLKRQDESQKGADAKRQLELIAPLFKEVEDDLLEKVIQLDALATDTEHELISQVRALRRVQQRLMTRIHTGRLADQQLRQHFSALEWIAKRKRSK